MNLNNFSQPLLMWFEQHGRHDLPWQQHKTDTPDPYQVWLSEVMLQQTQVKTVIPYFTKFMQSFPTVQDLANASWDEVAEHWAGLGYYARARNLHKGAKQLVAIIEQTGCFPQTVEDWEKISGVGRSTAGAVVAMGLHGYGVICDGNVKRVLTRWAGIEGDITKSVTNKQLWALAEQLTPRDNSGYFAQAMMDMGATVCHRTKPACITQDKPCPLQADCTAYAQGKQTQYPVKAKKKPKPSKLSQVLLLANDKQQVLWLQRPDAGIWGGLWSLPLQFIKKIEMLNVKATDVAEFMLNEIDSHNESNSDDNDASNQLLSFRHLINETIYEQEYNLAEQIIDEFIMSHALCSKALKSTNNKAIKHTLTHFHWLLLACPIKVTDEQMLKLNESLKQTMINVEWLTEQQALDKLALPKAMIKLMDA